MKKTILDIKNEQKELAQKLRLQKRLFKSKQSNGTDTWEDLREKFRLYNEFRHKHIARCLLRGRSYAQIEPKVRVGNEANPYLIDKYKNEYLSRFQEEKEFQEILLEKAHLLRKEACHG